MFGCINLSLGGTEICIIILFCIVKSGLFFEWL